MSEYNFVKMKPNPKHHLTLSKTQIHITREMVEKLGNPSFVTIHYDKDNQAIKLGKGGDRVVGFTRGRAEYPIISTTLGKYYMPLGKYIYNEKDDVFILERKGKYCTCAEPHISNGIVHRYDGKPCHLKETK